MTTGKIQGRSRNPRQPSIRARGLPVIDGTRARWQSVLERMLDELRSGSVHAQAYWAQQLAFGPVLIHAVALAVRTHTFEIDDQELLRQVVPLALTMLEALPDGCAGDPASLLLLARRQALVLTWGRRRHLTRLAARLGLDAATLPSAPVPRRFQRLYPLIGWRPPL